MSYIENDSLKEARVSYPDLIFKSKDVVGEGFFSRVYKATDDGKVYDDRYVTKKFNTNPITTLFMLGKLPQEMFRLEVEALKYLNDYAVVPKIVYFNLKKQYYIIEKLDKVLRIMIIERELTPEHISKFISMIKRLIKTPYRQTDFHNENIMWSNKLEDFRIIDWGFYEILQQVKEINDSSEETEKSIVYTKNGDIYLENKAIFDIQIYVSNMMDETKDKNEERKEWKEWKECEKELSILLPSRMIINNMTCWLQKYFIRKTKKSLRKYHTNKIQNGLQI